MVVGEDLGGAAAIDANGVQREFVDYTGTLAHWGARYADAITDAKAKAEALKDVEAEVFLELHSAKEKGDTEASLKARSRIDKRVRLARQLALEAEAREVRFKEKVMAPLYAKKEMLISLGAHQRAELGGDPLVRRAIREDLTALERRASLEDVDP